MRRKNYKLPTKLIAFLAVILLAIFLLIGYIWKVLTTSDFFSVKQVVVRNLDISFDYLKGRNIFTLDLSKQARQIFLNTPDCRKIRFSKILPDCIVIDFLKRKPIALVRFYKSFAVDEQGILFYPALLVEEVSLPIIYGLETKIFAPKPGVKYRRPEFDLALDIVRGFNSNKNFKGFTLKRIDVANLHSAGFFILLPRQVADYILPNPRLEWAGFEVRIGEGNIEQKLMILSGLIMQARKDWGNIKYIDLRFKEPLIKLTTSLDKVKS
ncbi:MAG: hypothetical protein WCY09_03250 [Candidatus Omnitrophota bacterium]